MKVATSDDFSHIIRAATFAIANADVVNVGEWQAQVNREDPKSETVECEDFSFEWNPPWGQDIAAAVQPNLPWAEEHFQERVSGIPHNPPPSHVNWPFAQKGNEEHQGDGRFSHTYPERMWAAWAAIPNYGNLPGDPHKLEIHPGKFPRVGVRYRYGDLNDVVTLLQARPGTRQAYLPIWFPEDTGAVEGQRVPCTLGYHFMVRNGRMKCVYYIRSCDFYRHFRDDVYMAVRLQQWLAQRVGVSPGKFVMHISSLHIFAVEQERIKREAQEYMLSSTRSW